MISKSKQDEIFTQQKQCVRIIANKKANSHVDDLFKQLKIVKFPDMIKIELCKFGYKTANNWAQNPCKILWRAKEA